MRSKRKNSRANLEKTATPLQSEGWFQEMVEELKNLLTEGEFSARYTIIQIYHTTGRTIAEHEGRAKNLVEETAKALGKSARLIYQCRQFFGKFPDLDDLPDGKAISWRHIANNLLPEHKEEKPKPLIENKIKEFLDGIQPDEFIPDRRKADDWKAKFKALIAAWEGWRK